MNGHLDELGMPKSTLAGPDRVNPRIVIESSAIIAGLLFWGQLLGSA